MSHVSRDRRVSRREAPPRQDAPHDGLAVLTGPGRATTPLLHTRRRIAAARLDEALPCALLDITSLPQHDDRRRYPTPTVLLRGADLFAMARPAIVADMSQVAVGVRDRVTLLFAQSRYAEYDQSLVRLTARFDIGGLNPEGVELITDIG